MSTSNLAKAIDSAFVDRADIVQYVDLPPAEAVYEILRSCLCELMSAGIVKHVVSDASLTVRSMVPYCWRVFQDVLTLGQQEIWGSPAVESGPTATNEMKVDPEGCNNKADVHEQATSERSSDREYAIARRLFAIAQHCRVNLLVLYILQAC
jgi:hypothetical protein